MKQWNKLEGKIYIQNCGCLTLFTESSLWASLNKEKITTDPREAKSIVTLGCQVTDLATLHSGFDYLSWNPYWDGIWNEERAKMRWSYYLGDLT